MGLGKLSRFAGTTGFAADKGFFTGKPDKMRNIPLLSPEQLEGLNNLFGAINPQIGGIFGGMGQDITQNQQFQQGAGTLSSLLQDFDPAATTQAFQQSVADPARQAFQEQTVPGIAERFAGVGATNSSGFNRALLNEAGNLESSLAGTLSQALLQGQQGQQALQSQGVSQAMQFAQLPQASQSQDIQNILQSLQVGLGTQQFQPMHQPGRPSHFASLVEGFAGGLGG